MNKDEILYKLILESPSVLNLGLANGQLGLSIFFFNLFTKTNEIIYKDIAEDLLENVLFRIDSNLNYDFDNGYLGILWGINYLAYNDYITIESDTCEEIINKILSINWSFVIDNNKKNILGLMHSILSQCLMKNKYPYFPLFDKYFLENQISLASKLLTQDLLKKENLEHFLFYIENGNINYKFNISDFIMITNENKSYNIDNLGLFNGLSGYYFLNYIL